MTTRAAGRLRHRHLALLAALLGGLAVLLGASNAGADATASSLNPAHGGSRTPFEIGPRVRHCAGSASASAAVETTYIFPLSVDPGSAYWTAPDQPSGTNEQPIGGYQPFVSGTSAHGLRSPHQRDLQRPAFWFAGMRLQPGIYHVGVTCLVPVGHHTHPRGAQLTAAKGETDDTLVAITASSTDPNGFTWSVCATPPAQLAEAPLAIALPLVGVLVAGGFVAVRHRRSRSRRSRALPTR
jgi:hypothetical protein